MAGDLGDVADGDRVLDQDEEAGDDVLDQRLRAETDGDTDDAGAGNSPPPRQEPSATAMLRAAAMVASPAATSSRGLSSRTRRRIARA